MKKLIYLILPILILVGCSSDDNSHDKSKVFIVSQTVASKKINDNSYESTITFTVKNDYKPASTVYHYIEAEIENYGKQRSKNSEALAFKTTETIIILKGDRPVLEGDIKSSTLIITKIVDDPIAN